MCNPGIRPSPDTQISQCLHLICSQTPGWEINVDCLSPQSIVSCYSIFRRELRNWIFLWVKVSTITTPTPTFRLLWERNALLLSFCIPGSFSVQQFSQYSHQNTVISLVTVRKNDFEKQRQGMRASSYSFLLSFSLSPDNTPCVMAQDSDFHIPAASF